LRFGNLALAACLPITFFIHATPAWPQQSSAQSSSLDESIPASALLEPAELLQIQHASEKPLVLQVGSHVLYAEAHIPGSEYVGSGGKDTGRDALRERVLGLEKNHLIVIYCGCCPWNRCPNIRPAYKTLKMLGFTHVKALYLPNNFGADWVHKGYPTASGS
jgi:thiosulfate/3-mercaptopyruvate sulfurtransferase